MNRNVLKALLQLFALVSGNSETNRRGRIIVEQFLLRFINRELLADFMLEFDELAELRVIQGNATQANKKRSSSSVKVLRICSTLNEELTQAQKGVVFLRLVEFLASESSLSEKDYDFLLTVASSFFLPEDQIEETIAFVEGSDRAKSRTLRAEIIQTGGKTLSNKYLEWEGLETEIYILKFPKAPIYFIKTSKPSDFLINGRQIKSGEIHAFPSGTVLRGSKIKNIYFGDIASLYLKQDYKEKIIFTAKQIEYNFPNGNKGLHKFSFSEQSGNLIGIMGSSGAGKSTLLNLLNGNERPTAGKVLINGQDLHSPETNKEGLIGYVSQDDLLIGELTVFENLWFNALLCFSGASKREILRRVHQSLAELGLLEIRDLKVGDALNKTISGGQRKRLNIALELIREPAVLFVDEPTSGLSSLDSEHIMDLLKELSLKGKLVFVVIHQPSSDIYKMFDRLIMLDTGGYPVYYGNPVEAIEYVKELAEYVHSSQGECLECGNITPEQIFDILESKHVDEYGKITSKRRISPKEWNIFFKRSQTPIDQLDTTVREMPQAGFKKPGRLGQLKIFFQRDFLAKLSNTQYMAINLLEAPLLAFIMGYLLRFSSGEEYLLYNNLNIPAYLLVCVIASLFFGLTVSAEEIFRDRGILRREKFLNLSRGSYLMAKMSLLFLLSAIQTGTFVAIGHVTIGISDLYLSDWAILFSVSCFANVLGLNISSSFNSAVTIYILIPILIIPQLLLSGVLVRFDQLNPALREDADKVPFSANMMASRWAYEAMAVNRFSKNKAENQVFEFDRIISNSNFIHNYWLPSMQGNIASDENPNAQRIVYNEISRINKTKQFRTFKNPERILTWNESTKTDLENHLEEIKTIALKREMKARVMKDSIIRELGNDYSKYVSNYSNEQLSRLVLRQDQFNKIQTSDSQRLVRNFEPVYQIPTSEGFFRGPFYGGLKYTGMGYIQTFKANIIILWIMTITMFIVLYFDGLKWIISRPKKLAHLIKLVFKRQVSPSQKAHE